MNGRAIFGLATLVFGMSAGLAAAQAGMSPGATAKEVFFQGTIDGKRDGLWLVVGLEDGIDYIRDVMRESLPLDALTDLPKDFSRIGDRVYNKRHEGDFVAAFHEATREVKEHGPEILGAPGRSLVQMKSRYSARLADARFAYDDTLAEKGSAALAVVNYTGWAAVAQLQGAYYLLLEVPLGLAWELTNTVAAYPVELLLQFGRFVRDLSAPVFGIGWVPLKFTGSTVWSAIVGSYSVVSASAASALTLAIDGAVKVGQGVKWLFYDLPRKAAYPIRVQADLGETGIEQAQVADIFATVWSKDVDPQKARLELSVGKHASMIRMVLTNADNDSTAALVKIQESDGKVFISFEVSRRYLDLALETVKAPGEPAKEGARKAMKSMIRAQMQLTLEEVRQSILAIPARAESESDL